MDRGIGEVGKSHFGLVHKGRNHPLAFNGVEIRDRSEMLSLTDMWKALASPTGRAPSDWLDLVTTKEFVACVEASFNAGNSGIRAKKGNGGGTYAHWQIGLAYAKYLSPEFHIWCNTVVRERMEGKPAPANALNLDAEARKVLGGIVKSVIHSENAIAPPSLPRAIVAQKRGCVRLPGVGTVLLFSGYSGSSKGVRRPLLQSPVPREPTGWYRSDTEPGLLYQSAPAIRRIQRSDVGLRPWPSQISGRAKKAVELAPAALSS